MIGVSVLVAVLASKTLQPDKGRAVTVKAGSWLAESYSADPAGAPARRSAADAVFNANARPTAETMGRGRISPLISSAIRYNRYVRPPACPGLGGVRGRQHRCAEATVLAYERTRRSKHTVRDGQAGCDKLSHLLMHHSKPSCNKIP